MMKIISFGKKLSDKIKQDRATGLASEQAYYYMLALFPLLILLLSTLPYLSIEPQKALDIINSFIPSETTSVLEDNIIQIISERNEGLLTFGVLATLWSASSGMDAFIHSMNIAFEVEETRNFIKIKFMSILLTFCLIIAFIVALILPVFGNLVLDAIKERVLIPDQLTILLHILRWFVSVAVIAVVITILYRFAPNRHYMFKQVIPGAVTATVIWLVISLGFSIYVSNFANYSSTYGSLGGVIILMLWLYFTGLALVIGGEVNALFHHGDNISKNRKPNRTYHT
jgi:membrane protein